MILLFSLVFKKEGVPMKNHLFNILAYLIVLTFLFQPIQTLANSDQVEISDNSSMGAAQTPMPGEPNPEQFEKEFEIEIEAERQRILEEHLREEGMPEELLSHEYGSDPQEKPEYIPPSPEVIAKTQEQVNSFSCSTVTDVPQIECEALVALYSSTNGAGWTNNTNWLLTSTVNDWFGVEAFENSVRGLGLHMNGLTGSICHELGNLSNLDGLLLGSNNLIGSIPAELGNLSNLIRIDLSWNALSGIIPTTFSNLYLLDYLDLSWNNLTGSIPIGLGSMTNLSYLNLSVNDLTGSIPSSLGSLINLNHLALSSNHLTGEIPSSIGNLTNLEILHLHNNQLRGVIPVSFSEFSNLEDLCLDSNQLSGNIPSFLGSLTKLWRLTLSSNNFTGSIPPQFGQLTSLRFLHIDSNLLTGAIPAELGNLTSLHSLYLNNNNFAGTIPLSFTNLTNLDYFWFEGTTICEPTTPEFLAWKTTVTMWIGTNIICPLNADIGFRAVPDGYGFPNWGGINLSDFTYADLTRMFGTDAVCWKIVGTTCILKPKAELFVYQVNIPMAGHCLGMAVSSLRFYKDIDLPLSLEEVYFQVKDSAVLTNWQSETFSTTIRRNISYFHVMQQADPFKAYSDGSMKNTPSEILSEVSLAMSGAEQNYPILFFYRTDMRGGHAVTPYAVEDKGNGIYWIRIYDNNFPGYHDKKIIVDINNETWFYNDRYKGTRDSHNLGTAPISIFSQRPVCPWCENTLNAVPMMQLYHEGAGDLLIQDSYSRRLGFQDGVFYSEIPGAYALPVLGGLDVDTQPIFYLPLTDEYALTLAGLPTKSVGEASIVAFGPGYGITINGIDVDSNTMDVISISNDGTIVNYQPNQDQDLTYGFYLDTDNASWQLETSQVDVNASQISVITVDPFQKSLEIDNVQNNTGEYNLYFKRVSDDGTNYFASNKILFPALSSHYVHIDGWQETGSAQVDIDTNGDGVPEEIINLGNQIKYIFLPFVYR